MVKRTEGGKIRADVPGLTVVRRNFSMLSCPASTFHADKREGRELRPRASGHLQLCPKDLISGNDLQIHQNTSGAVILGFPLGYACACPELVPDFPEVLAKEMAMSAPARARQETPYTWCSLCKLYVHPGAPGLGKSCWVY